MRKLTINRIDFETAFELNDFGSEAYLDSETGAVIIVTDETNMQLEPFISENDNLEAVLSKLRADETLPDWQRDMLIAAAEVKFADDPEHYKLVPKQDSHEGYRDTSGRWKMSICANCSKSPFKVPACSAGSRMCWDAILKRVRRGSNSATNAKNGT